MSIFPNWFKLNKFHDKLSDVHNKDHDKDRTMLKFDLEVDREGDGKVDR